MIEAVFDATTELSIAEAAFRPEPVPELVLSTGARFRFDRPLVVGRRADNGDTSNIFENEPRVEFEHRVLSRRHALVAPVGRRASVVDLGSTNGTVIVAPDRPPIVCQPGHLVLIETGWTIEFGGVVWASIEPHGAAAQGAAIGFNSDSLEQAA